MVKLAPHLGFCFGVRRSVEIVEDLLQKGKKIYTLGEIIHNSQVCEKLKLKGVRVVNEDFLNGLDKGVNLVFRAHGVGPQVYEICRKFEIKWFDATCPFVKRIHNIVCEQSKNGNVILILGDENHPEVQAIKKYCFGDVFVFDDFLAIRKFLKFREGNFVVVAQTTYSSVLWNQGLKEVENFTNVKIFNTICNATIQRQSAAVELSKEVDFMIVIGDRNSSNSRKLFDLCSKFCKSCFVESKFELENLFKSTNYLNKIGIAAGASTPDYVINEIFEFVKKSNM